MFGILHGAGRMWEECHRPLVDSFFPSFLPFFPPCLPAFLPLAAETQSRTFYMPTLYECSPFAFGRPRPWMSSSQRTRSSTWGSSMGGRCRCRTRAWTASHSELSTAGLHDSAKTSLQLPSQSALQSSRLPLQRCAVLLRAASLPALRVATGTSYGGPDMGSPDPLIFFGFLCSTSSLCYP